MTSTAVGSSASVAPKWAAASRRAELGSDTMIRDAPAMRAPWTTEIPMPPSPITSTVAPGTTFAAVDDRTHAGLQGAADHGREIERHIGVESHHAGFHRDHTFREPAHAEPAVNNLTFTRERRRSVREQAGEHGAGSLADRVLATHAPVAVAARRERDEHHVVTGFDRRHARTDCLYHAGRFMAEDYRQRGRRRRFDHREIGMAQPTMMYPHLHHTDAGFREIDIADELERLVRVLEQGSAHRNP